MAKRHLILLIVLLIVIITGVVYLSRYIFLGPREVVIEDPTLKKIKNSGKIMVGTDASYPPMESIDDAGNFVGLDIDIVKEIATDLGVKAEIKNIPWEKLISFQPLYEKEVDALISAITITPERAEKVAFSDPYFNAGQVIVTTIEKSNEIKGLEDLAGKRLGVQIDTTSEIEAKKYTNPELILALADYELVLNELLSGNIDAIIIDYPAALALVSQKEGLKIVGEPFTQEFYGIAVRKEDKVLLAEINKTIKKLKKGNKLEDLIKKWFTK